MNRPKVGERWYNHWSGVTAVVVSLIPTEDRVIYKVVRGDSLSSDRQRTMSNFMEVFNKVAE